MEMDEKTRAFKHNSMNLGVLTTDVIHQWYCHATFVNRSYFQCCVTQKVGVNDNPSNISGVATSNPSCDYVVITLLCLTHHSCCALRWDNP